TARAGMSSLMVSGAIERATGLEAIPHLTTRDWTVLGLESMLLGAHAEGVRNILAITGDPPEVGDYPGARGVYEIDSIGLTRLGDPRPRRHLPAHELPAGAAPAQRSAGDHRPAGAAGGARSGGPERGGDRDGARARAPRGLPRPLRRRVPRRPLPAADVGAGT